jgi:hypothetical protein
MADSIEERWTAINLVLSVCGECCGHTHTVNGKVACAVAELNRRAEERGDPSPFALTGECQNPQIAADLQAGERDPAMVSLMDLQANYRVARGIG